MFNGSEPDIAATVLPVFTQFGMVTHVGPPNVKLRFLVFKNPTWRTAGIFKIEELLQNFMELQNDALHKFGNKTVNTLSQKNKTPNSYP